MATWTTSSLKYSKRIALSTLAAMLTACGLSNANARLCADVRDKPALRLEVLARDAPAGTLPTLKITLGPLSQRTRVLICAEPGDVYIGTIYPYGGSPATADHFVPVDPSLLTRGVVHLRLHLLQDDRFPATDNGTLPTVNGASIQYQPAV